MGQQKDDTLLEAQRSKLKPPIHVQGHAAE
jgi:hypothetical protein